MTAVFNLATAQQLCDYTERMQILTQYSLFNRGLKTESIMLGQQRPSPSVLQLVATLFGMACLF